MSGPTEEGNVGKHSHRDSSPQGKVGPNVASAAREDNVLMPEVGGLALPQSAVRRLSESRNAYETWIEGLAETLSPEGRALIATQFMQALRNVPHSTVAHSRVFGYVDVNRFQHCVHAAYTARALGSGGQLGLIPKEVPLAELSLLLHDPHRLGSHALDRTYASMPGSPKNFNTWWPMNDYHEYHGAVAIAKNPEIRRILGRYYHDVMAILTHDDRRSPGNMRADYGELRPRLSKERRASLVRLKGELDRCSYLKLDYLRSGFTFNRIVRALHDVERHEQTLTARGAGIQLNILPHLGERPYDDVAQHRSFYRAELATLPVGCLVEEAIFKQGVWDKARETFSSEFLRSKDFYQHVRDCALREAYEEIFSEDALKLLAAARSGGGLCVEDVYAPIVDMTLDDISDDRGVRHLSEYLPPGLAEAYCGVPRRDMTQFEGCIRQALTKENLDPTIHVLTSNDYGRRFVYDVSRPGRAMAREVSETQCHRSLIKVTIAARAIDKAGEVVDLSKVRRTIHAYLAASGILRNPAVLDRWNPRVFCDLVTPAYFSESVRATISAYNPEWITRGGCGLL
jgi:hypothetical protein